MTSIKRCLPMIALILIAASGLIAAGIVLRLDRSNTELAFATVADQATNLVREQRSRHLLLLAATAAHFEAARGWITADEFGAYFQQLNLPVRAPGSVGLGYLAFAERAQLPELAAAYSANNGAPLELWPESDAPRVAAAVLFEAIAGEAARASGFDNYAIPARREALDRAVETSAPTATAPLPPARGDGKGPLSIVIYMPVYATLFGIEAREGSPPRPTGFVIVVFRASTFFRAAFEGAAPLAANVTLADAADPDTVLAEVGPPADPRRGADLTVRNELDVAGRTWIVVARPSTGFHPRTAAPFAIALAVLSLLLGCAVAATLRQLARTHDATEELALTSQRNLEEKDLMLQEMKHRIKNAIGRILAMARQTANGSTSIEGFLQSFTQRLQAMSNAQDMLTRSKWQRADLGELLRQELAQVFGADFDGGRLTGPAVELDERCAQALGLTFHELATNTLKYSGGTPNVDVAWHIAPSPSGQEELILRWRERSRTSIEPPERVGFGTKLIDLNIRYELGGEIERDYAPGGLRLTLAIPLRNGVIRVVEAGTKPETAR